MSDDKDTLKALQTVKVMLVGNSETGKTLLYNKFTSSSDQSVYTPTVFEVNNIEVECDNKTKINVTIWDLAGSCTYDGIRPISYAHADCFIICYHIHNRNSFEDVETRWLPEIAQHGDGPKVPIILVGVEFAPCTVDDAKKKQEKSVDQGIVSKSEGEDMKTRVGAKLIFHYSVPKGIGAHDILQNATQLALVKKTEEETPPNPIWKFQPVEVLVIGDKGVGKSSLIKACIQSERGENIPTESFKKLQEGHEFFHNFVKDGCEYFMRITEFQEERDLNSYFDACNKIDAVILCYAVNDPFSFQSIEFRWNNIIKPHRTVKKFPCILIGTKCDLIDESGIVIPTTDGDELMLALRSKTFFECSAKTSINTSTLFETVINYVKE